MFLGLQTNKDPQNFLDKIMKIFEVMQVNGNDHLELASYMLKDMAHIWYAQWKVNSVENTTPITWELFNEPFLIGFS